MSEMTFKLYSPLTAELLSDGSEYWNDTDSIVLRGYELTDYVEAITAQIAEEGTNIEQYMDAEDDPYLAAHVKSIRLSVEERDGELCGCATVIVDEDLTERGWNDLQDYITGQYSDGWGEGFEQRDIEVEDGILIWLEAGESSYCLFVDELLGEQQVVVKPLPSYLNSFNIKRSGIAGCTILGDGNISIILDVGNLYTPVQ